MPRARTPKLPVPRESAIQRAILDYLRSVGLEPWRNNTGATKTAHGSFVRYGKVGSGDLFALLPPHGRLLSVEVKRPGRKPTDEQVAFMEAVNAAGGLAIVATSVDDVRDALATERGPGRE
jgi:hypothetical protein